MTVTSFPGATTYAKAMEILVRRGDSLDELNRLSRNGNLYATALWEKQGYTLRTNLNYRNKSLNQAVPQGE